MALLRIAFLAASLAALVSASPYKRQSESYTLCDSATGAAINANGGAFYVGRPTVTGCAADAECSAYTNQTTVGTSDEGRMYMSATVPGGQDVYVASDGALSFTEPHEEGIYPSGSYQTGFAQASDNGQTILEFSGAPNVGWALCGDYGQVFALIDDTTECANMQRLNIILDPAAGPGAFEFE